MSERPILFSAPMVRAILAGTKTQTRRVMKPQPEHPHFGRRHMLAADDEGVNLYLHSSTMARAIRCPYGQPGDKLWVRESGAIAIDKTAWMYADAGGRLAPTAPPHSASWAREWKACPSIHMPRWASRITLEITGVRVERLQDISKAEALYEGIVPGYGGFGLPDGSHFHAADPRESYWSLWEAINGPGSVEANPWVWCVEFRRLEAGAITRAPAALAPTAQGERLE